MAIDECANRSAMALMCTPDSSHATAAESRNVRYVGVAPCAFLGDLDGTCCEFRSAAKHSGFKEYCIQQGHHAQYELADRLRLRSDATT